MSPGRIKRLSVLLVLSLLFLLTIFKINCVNVDLGWKRWLPTCKRRLLFNRPVKFRFRCAVLKLPSSKVTQKCKLYFTDPIGVVGLDVAGDEGSNPLSSSDHQMAAGVKSAVAQGVPVTVHAGEWPEKYGTLENVRYTVQRNPECLAAEGCHF